MDTRGFQFMIPAKIAKNALFVWKAGKQDKEFRITKFGVTQLLNEQFVYFKGFFRITNRNTT